MNELFAFSNKYDAAIVATPHDTAVALLPKVFPLAPFVLVEKPLGRTAAEAESLIAAAAKSGSRIFVGLNYRFLKNVQHLQKLLSFRRVRQSAGRRCRVEPWRATRL